MRMSSKQPEKKAGKAAPAKKPAKKKAAIGRGMNMTAQPTTDKSESVSIRTRRITNGWLTSTSKQKSGKYSEQEVFTRSKPKIGINVAGEE